MHTASQSLVADAALWASEILFVLAILLILWILFLRVRYARRHERAERIGSTWEPLRAQAVDAVPAELPPVDVRDTHSFLLLWNYMQEIVRDEARQRLNDLACRLGIGDASLDMLCTGTVQQRLVALTTLGHLRDHRAWDELEQVVLAEDPVLSLCAAKALLRIDPARAANTLMPLVTRRADWPPALIASMLEEAGPDAMSVPIAFAVSVAPEHRMGVMVRYLELVHADVAAPLVRQLLRRSTDADVLASCLRVLSDPQDLDIVRDLLGDERQPVRLHAAVALGRLGDDTDRALLVRAIGDREWWVRYRAAQALARLPSVDAEVLDEIALGHPDRYARDMVTQVLAEEALVS